MLLTNAIANSICNYVFDRFDIFLDPSWFSYDESEGYPQLKLREQDIHINANLIGCGSADCAIFIHPHDRTPDYYSTQVSVS
jgi:hypothetical protein